MIMKSYENLMHNQKLTGKASLVQRGRRLRQKQSRDHKALPPCYCLLFRVMIEL